MITAIHTDDLEFVEKVVNGDQEAAELLLSRCRLWTGHLARMAGLPKQEWGDVANDALLSALRQMQRGLFRGESSFQTWAERIIRGKIADYWRGPGTERTAWISLDAEFDKYSQEVDRNVPLIHHTVLRKTDYETRMMVRQALRTMSQQHAVILLLNAREGYSTVEISRQFDLPQGTVGRKLCDAKKQFRRFFDAPLKTILKPIPISAPAARN